MKSMQEQYLESLSPKEKQAYEIARSYLGTLFTLEKTTGYINWIKSKSPPIISTSGS